MCAAVWHPGARFPAATPQNCGSGSDGSWHRYAAAHPVASGGQGCSTQPPGAAPASGAASLQGLSFLHLLACACSEPSAAACESSPAGLRPSCCAAAVHKLPAPANLPVPSSAVPLHAGGFRRKASSPPPREKAEIIPRPHPSVLSRLQREGDRFLECYRSFLLPQGLSP